ncbi:hypothetical protein A2291_06880 [candidate division WOR-1 bacterium RIFOXYB2_FULL_42_35]|uniref:Uncharacterized protein n=1 Tax=candidate division WOR-1 bacterium RIFOXYC2_FULL_41_25 TaxID=1802586 RepID=A0A1F4TPZ9_UNCSA|nr:MAG: hypothetical protein A2291_06880 [candidate division WOR-1 bacterium RIFOXYB2_FULL_42_35]OGC24603.1 MAG: hypothetical protein A2247_06660 [candidate division WOR-1 bacterium RIFOXYA2_FULL_41_14]OGC34649.1 MAG: hypothetical protein A2462_04895 [candidate division WOR-1 bacterium RIFOXYC2_FULL_41_25]OGC41598.1 MAG: hypothetical protein A2548_01210 [candidate division WOR-1 bacterium RIFOXYD2_FULL_41_8]
MKLFAWLDSKVKKLDLLDITLTKLAVLGFALLVAKLWSPILSLDWYWYAIIYVVAAIRPMARFLSK